MHFDPKQYKVYTWKHPAILHWIINPGLVINDLILGQKVPKISLIDTTLEKPLIERGFVPCPHCNTLHDSRTWSFANKTAFKNWFGLYCPACGDIIPCVMNATSWAILFITAPLWYGFKNTLKEKWLKAQPARYLQINLDQTETGFEQHNWYISGLNYGAFMFLFMEIIVPLFEKEAYRIPKLLIGLFVWTIAGLFFGRCMKWYFSQLGKKSSTRT